MSYREEGDQVIVTMDLLDWELLLMALGRALATYRERDERCAFFSLVNRLNQGNPRYTPYQVDSTPPARR